MARPYSRVIFGANNSGVQAISGTAPQVVTSTAFECRQAQAHTLSCELDYDILTNTITFTATWQVSKDGTNWINHATVQNNAASVVFATGTGAQVAGKLIIGAPDGVYGFPYARCVVTSGTGSGQGAGKDDVTFSFNYVKSFNGS